MTFPEGTRRKTARIKPFKQGMFHLSIKSGVSDHSDNHHRSGRHHAKKVSENQPGKITMIIDRPHLTSTAIRLK